MSRGLLLIDGSNVGHAAAAGPSLKVGEQPTQSIYGFLRTLRPMVASYAMLTPIVLWDGAPWRKMVFEEYKEARNKIPTTKAEIEAARIKSEFKQQIPFIKKALEHLGVRQIWAANYEADDLAGVLVQKCRAQGRTALMITGDKDWVQLLGKGVGWLDPVRGDRLAIKTLTEKLGYHPDKKKFAICDGKNVEGFLGVPSPRAWLEIKCLMGDISDSIPGVGGVGPAGAIELILKYGSFASFLNQVADKTVDIKALPKKFADLATDDEKQDKFRRNMRLMDLTTSERPEAVNLTINAGSLDPAKFEALCKQFLFRSILKDLNGWLEPFQPKMENAA